MPSRRARSFLLGRATLTPLPTAGSERTAATRADNADCPTTPSNAAQRAVHDSIQVDQQWKYGSNETNQRDAASCETAHIAGSTRSRGSDMSTNVYQTSYELLRETLRDALATAAGSGRGGIDSTTCRASAALYALLGEHSVDRRGHCRCCRGLRALGRRRRACRVLVAARFYLYQPEDLLLRLLASELTQPATPPPSTDTAPDPGRAPGAVLGDPDATDVLPRIS
jgi:hypothetical protein